VWIARITAWYGKDPRGSTAQRHHKIWKAWSIKPQDIDNSELPEFHRLRIQVKRLRYALEFVAPAYGSSLNDVILQTVRLQDNLGDLQDTVFNQKLIKRILKDCKGKLLDDQLISFLVKYISFRAK